MLTKLVVLAAAIAIAWYGFKFVSRLDERRKAKIDNQRADAAQSVNETVKCRACGAYVPVNMASNCGRGDCPY